ncbi:DcrB-related protein [Sphingomonas sp. Leaf242]|uniref:DcrB-related protein n=1 Tax=Sphingomonas sp. Leaf242 TaxID=1736304 RepID=UPI0007142057|nr:DcrB-related protein [Sphingomonas sp. Leaf242]KQO09373.1 hypothetical protein ASF09_07025 [Sphingomonas sp. Leaf242]
MTQVQGVTITCPDGWLDKSMLVLSAAKPGPSGVSPNFVVTHEPMPDDLRFAAEDALNAFVERQIEQMRTTLPGPVSIARRQAADASGLPELRVDWTADRIPLTQWIGYNQTDDGTVTIATGTAGKADFSAVEPVFHAMLRSFRIA